VFLLSTTLLTQSDVLFHSLQAGIVRRQPEFIELPRHDTDVCTMHCLCHSISYGTCQQNCDDASAALSRWFKCTYICVSKRRCTHLKPISELLLVADDINRLLTPLVDFLQTQPDATVMLRSVLQMDDSSTVQCIACLHLHTSAALAKQIMH